LAWPLTHRSALVESETGVPVPGKGENSWDCGEDALYSLSTTAATIDEAIEKFKASVMKTRERYGGKDWMPMKAEAV
jgi:hypothetical protein